MPVIEVFENPFFSSEDKKPLMMLSLRFVPLGLFGLYSCIVTVSRPYCLGETDRFSSAHCVRWRWGRRFLAGLPQRQRAHSKGLHLCAVTAETNMISQFENKPTARAQRGYTLCKVTGRAGLWSVLGVSGLACCDGAGFSCIKVLSIMPKQQDGKYSHDQVDQ
jgi:hypothetical protein